MLFLSSFFASCGDDTVTPPQSEFDPPRFNWRTVEIPGQYNGFSGIWAKDTSNIYLINYFPANFTHIFKSNIETFNIGNYGVTEIEGITENEIYIFGAVPYPDNTLTIIKWNGAGFEYFPTGIIVGTNNAQIKGCVVSSNEIWIGTENGLSKFDGINFYNYTYGNPNLFLKDIFLGNNGKVQYIAERQFNETTIQTSLYEFRDTSFIRIFNEISTPYPIINLLSEVNGYKIGIEMNLQNQSVCLNNFIDTSFIPYICFSNKIEGPMITTSNNPVGMNLQNFIFLVTAKQGFFEHTRIGIINWNGSRFSKELELGYPGSYPYDAHIAFGVNQNNYLVLEPGYGTPAHATLFIGSKK
jgi:hypothetical protein